MLVMHLFIRIVRRLLRVTARLRGTLLRARTRTVMRLYMFGQVIAAHKSLVADRAGEPLLTSMRSQMALQFIGPCEPFAAKQPIADERSFAGVQAEMRLQVAGFAVDFAAAGNVAAVDVLLA